MAPTIFRSIDAGDEVPGTSFVSLQLPTPSPGMIHGPERRKELKQQL